MEENINNSPFPNPSLLIPNLLSSVPPWNEIYQVIPFNCGAKRASPGFLSMVPWFTSASA